MSTNTVTLYRVKRPDGTWIHVRHPALDNPNGSPPTPAAALSSGEALGLAYAADDDLWDVEEAITNRSVSELAVAYGEAKADSWGVLDGRLVLVDYGS